MPCIFPLSSFSSFPAVTHTNSVVINRISLRAQCAPKKGLMGKLVSAQRESLKKAMAVFHGSHSLIRGLRTPQKDIHLTTVRLLLHSPWRELQIQGGKIYVAAITFWKSIDQLQTPTRMMVLYSVMILGVSLVVSAISAPISTMPLSRFAFWTRPSDDVFPSMSSIAQRPVERRCGVCVAC